MLWGGQDTFRVSLSLKQDKVYHFPSEQQKLLRLSACELVCVMQEQTIVATPQSAIFEIYNNITPQHAT